MRTRWAVMMGLLVLALDRLSKRAFEAADAVLLPGLIHLRGTRNIGAAFGLFGGGTGALTLISGLTILALLAYLLIRRPGGMWGLGLWLILFGAMGNLYDRLLQGYVIDFIELSFVQFPIFNVADMAVTLGCALAALGVLLGQEHRHG